MKKNSAITLISLVITIVVIIILTGITISLTIGENGIFTKSKQAKIAHEKAAAKEILDLKVTDIKLGFISEQKREPNLKELAIKLEEDTDTISSVSTTAQIASIEDIDFSSVTAIYVKVLAYPSYEFEIKQDLGINDPVQVAASNEEELKAAQKLLEENETTISELNSRISDLEQQLLDKAGYINPAGEEEIDITTNGTITRDIKEKASVKINTNVPIPTGYLRPTGILNITTNGEHNVKDYEKVNVNITTDKKYTQEEYDEATKTENYYKKDNLNLPYNFTNYTYNCGFKPSFAFIKCSSSSGKSMVFWSDNSCQKFYVNISNQLGHVDVSNSVQVINTGLKFINWDTNNGNYSLEIWTIK